MITTNLLGRWLESLDYEYHISPDCSRHQSPRSSCTACIDQCPVDAITLVDGKPVIYNEDCIECGDCVANCPIQAVEGFLPKRTIKNDQFIIDGNRIPTIKELLVYYKKGITTIVCEQENIHPDWEKTIQEANQMLEDLGEPPFQVAYEQDSSNDDKKISRRELFFIWERGLKNIGKQMAPAKWRFNHESLDLLTHYPDHQFVDISLDLEQCTLCKACQVLCKNNCLEVNEDHFSISPQQCTNCSLCQDICPEGAISIKEMITPTSPVDYQVFNNVCSSCEETFTALDEDKDLCLFCTKRDEYAMI